MNPSAEGLVYPDVSFTVDPERVRAFREIFGQSEGVPPTFVTAAEFTVYPLVIGDPRLELDFARVVHGSQSYLYRRPLREGETLTIRARIESAKIRAGNGFLTIVVELFDDDADANADADADADADREPVVTARSQLIERAPDA